MYHSTLRRYFTILLALAGLPAFAQEPTNYPTGLSATTLSSTSIRVDWTGSVSGTLPTNYVVYAKTSSGTITAPVDGTLSANDSNYGDGVGFEHVAHAVGANTFTFNGLPTNETFTFVIYPYKTGGTPDPDYKTGATPPSTTGSTKAPVMVSTTAASNINVSSADLGGEIGTAPNNITERGTVWKTSAGVTIGDNKLAEGNTGTGTFSHNRVSLPSGVRIYYAAYATNVVGTTLSTEASFYTFSAAPASHPTVTAEAQSPTQIDLTFPAASTITDAAGYIILRTTGSAPTAASIQDGVAPGSLNLNGATLVTTITNTSTTTYSNTGLTANTRYYYAVVPYNWNGTNAQTYNYRGGTFNTDDDVTLSSSSTVAFTAGTAATTPIAYRTYQSGNMTNDGSNSLALGTFQIRDGGASNNDADNKPTILESITFGISNSANVRRVALYNGTTEISGTEQNAGGTVTFTPSTPITVGDDGNVSISIRATFQAAVTDNQTIHFTVTGVTTVTGTPTSRFAAADGGGAVSSPATDNKINVVASKFLYTGLPSSALSTGQTFSLTVRAVDGNPYNNLDLDYNKQVDLEVTGGSGTIQPGATNLAPSLSNGVYTWSNIYFNIAGTYTLKVIDDAYNPDPDLSDISGNVTVSSAGVTVTPPPTLNLCYGGIAQPLGNIVITETDVTDFSNSGTVSLALPPGFVFDQTVTTKPTIGPAGNLDISNPSNLSYPATNVVEFSYTVSGTDKLSTITITGLKVRYTNTSAASGSITRLGGTANIAGDQVSDAKPHGSVTAVLGTAPSPFLFTVAALTGEVPVAPTQKRFSKSSNAVRLIGQPAGGVFSGPGVTFTSGEYRFNPSTLSADTYTITYTYKDASAQQCEFIHTEDFEVYVTNINNLEVEYCNNADQSPTLNVSASYITSQYGPGFTFQKFVYFNPSVGQTDMAVPANNIFDPKQAVYQPIYAATASIYGTYGIWIGFVVSNGSFTFPEWQLVPIKQAPAVTFFIPKVEFCSNEAPVVLTGDPANGDNPSDDFFKATGTAVTSVTSSGTPRVWSFNPASVTGVTASTPVTFNMTYTYRDPNTGCQNTSAAQQIKVSLRPPIVPSGNITPGTAIEVCQGATIGSFTAAAVAQTSYVWYSNNPPTTVVGAGNTFVPPVSNLIAGTSTFYVTQSINGCESTQAPRSLTVEVKASPAAPGSDFNREYCQFQNIPSSELQVTGTAVKWYDANNVLTHSGSNPSATDLDIDNTVAGPYGFSVTQTVAGCEGAKTKVGVTIKPLPNLDILSTTGDPNKICVTGGPQTFQATDNGAAAQNGTWSGTGGINSALIPNATFGTVQLNASLLSPNSYTLHLVYQNPTTLCSNTKDLALTVLPTIAPSYTIGTACDGFPVSITNNSTIVPSNATATIASTSWIFGDGASLVAGNGAIPVGTNTGKTTGTYFSPNHIFNGIGNFLAQFTMVTSDGCIVTPPQIPVTINPNPDGAFGWRNVCVDPSGGSDTEFLAGTSNIPEANIQSYEWNFAKHNLLVIGTAGTGKTPHVNYTSIGADTVRLIITTTASCKDTIQKPVYMVPSFGTVTETNAYTQDFNATADGWIAGGVRSSWAHGHPAGATVNKDASPNGQGGAWDTNLTGNSNAGEQSWVMSRCFDFSQAQKPIISFDIWSDTPAGNDGAVLQYNTSGNIENEAQWQVVGQIGQGVNWYDESGISSRPGNQPSNDLGWTGIYGDWKKATFKLDNLIGEANVVFRIAFASNAPRREGFAFDNVFIGERTRTVLIENFTNSSAAANGTAHNALFNNFSQGSQEIAKIQFHTAFPGSDPLNAINAEINNARTAFYGITTSPTFSLDGNVVNTTPALEALYNERILTPSPIRLDVTMVKDGEVVKIKTSITNATSQVLPTAGVNVFTTVVEKTITDPAYLGASGNAEFQYVAKEMLPTAAGIRLTQDIAPMQTIVLDEVVWRNRDLLTSGEGAVVVFVQSIEGGNKEVFQAKLIDASVEPDFVTANEPTFGDQVRIYPNPARGEVNIDLPVKAAQELPISLVDGFGRTVYQQVINRGDKRKTISTANFADGVYILQVRSAEGSVTHRKLVITH